MDVNHLHGKVNVNHKPIFVTRDVEDHSATFKNASVAVLFLHFGWARPLDCY